ncbi:MAG: transcriptional regulator with XRE-family HTH domain [Arenicella sp.]|jgi:transcriptional regulator with XRE-family HTH domain
MIVRKLRLQRGWSQEQLAHISALNVRTIQPIERGQAPSLESKKSLAAAFEVQLATFDNIGKATAEPDADVALIEKDEANMTDQENAVRIEDIKADEEYAINYAKGIKEFYNHLLMYLIFAVTIIVVKGFDDSVVIWGLLGWTVGVIVHGLNAYEMVNLFNANWERKIAEKKLGRKR